MNEARPYASLSSGLLARKGSAKPAMRPQGYTGFEDLGWNDMGLGREEQAVAEHVPSSIAALTPFGGRAADPVVALEPKPEAPPAPPVPLPEPPETVPEPDVVAQQRAIIEKYDVEPAPEEQPTTVAAEIVKLPRRASVPAGKKAAFTLRLDSERHMRLRLATALLGRSAQQFVTDALDQALARLPEVETLASQLPAAGAARN